MQNFIYSVMALIVYIQFGILMNLKAKLYPAQNYQS